MALLVLSQYVEERYASELLATENRGIGYLLKDRIADVMEFIDALYRVAAGGTVLDPDVVRQLLARSRRTGPLSRLTAREREVLALMAEGQSTPDRPVPSPASIEEIEPVSAASTRLRRGPR